MLKTFRLIFSGIFLSIFLIHPIVADAAEPVSCSSRELLQEYQSSYAKTNSALVSMQAMQSILSDSFKVDAVLSRFINATADGKFIKEIETITAVRKGYSINPRTLNSAKLGQFYKNIDLRPQPIAEGLTSGYDRMAMLVSVAGFAANSYTAFSTGDRLAHAKSAKDAIDIGTASALAYRGWQGLNIAFNSVAFVDYALNTFITAQYAQYNEYWWQAYRSYLDDQYPKMVTGKNSWAALAVRGDNGKTFEARLTEFWSEKATSDGIARPADRAAHYYKVPSPFQRDALATSTDSLKKDFAARYYTETLQTTLDTYFKRQAENLRFEAEDKLDKAVSALCEYMTEIKSLQISVAKLQAGAPLKSFKVKAARDTYKGAPLTGAVVDGDIVAFSAQVPLPEGQQGKLKWVILDSSKKPVEGASKSTDIETETGSTTAKFRLKFSGLEPGRYAVRLTHQASNKSIKSISDSFAFTIGLKPSVRITRMWVTNKPRDQTDHASLSPDQTPVLYVAFDMSDGLEKIHKKLVVRDRSSGAIIVSSEGEKVRKNDNRNQRTGVALSPGDLKPGGAYRFEASLTLPGGKSVKSHKDFEIADPTQGKKAEVVSEAKANSPENADAGACRMDEENKHMALLQKAASEAMLAERKASKAPNEMNRAFVSKVRNKQSALGEEFAAITEQRSGLSKTITALKAKSKKQKLTQSEIENGNRLIEKYQALSKQRKKLGKSTDSISKFLSSVFDQQKEMSCEQFANHIHQTSIGRKFNYNVQTALRLCDQANATKTVYTKRKAEMKQGLQAYRAYREKCAN